MNKPTTKEMLEAVRTNDLSDDEIAGAIRDLILIMGKWKKQIKEGDWDKFSPVELMYEVRDFGEEEK